MFPLGRTERVPPCSRGLPYPKLPIAWALRRVSPPNSRGATRLEDIRRCRQELFCYTDRAPIKNVVMAWDFFSINECRDLLFHVREHRLTLPEIADFLAENKLQFLGFVLNPQTLRNYARQFPADTAMTDLAQWHRFESENPYTFGSMYHFWIQKNPG